MAPTNYVAFKKFSLYSKLDKVISILLKYTNHKIVFRPHPSNLNSAKVKKILKKYKNSKKFYFDKSADYSKIYNDSLCLITDISGTAYTYAFYTKNPVVFYANYQKKIEKKYKYLNYFKDRKKIGKIFRRLNQFKSIDSLFTNRASYKKNINKIIVQKISIGKTKENFFKELKKL